MGEKRVTVHSSIRTRLGYAEDVPDREVLADWKRRTALICKPCWELKYCPYGPFVEQSPLLPTPRADVEAHIEYMRECLDTGILGRREILDEETKAYYNELVALSEEEPQILAHIVARELHIQGELDQAAAEGRNPMEVFAPPMEGFERYRVPFPMGREVDEIPEIEITPEIQEGIDIKLAELKEAIATGVRDLTRPLDHARREMFEEEIKSYDPEQHPEFIPDEIADMRCNVFGHLCPVIFVAESITETTERRRRGRYLPFQVKIRVARRDNYTCQVCGRHLRDDEVEFDHIIPHSKGGSAEEHNIQLTCFDCNRAKSDNVDL